MECQYYDFYNFFTEVVFGWKCQSYTECEIYELGERVYKVFNSTLGSWAKGNRHLEEIAALDPKLLTVPIAKLYLDNEYSGFEMENGGVSLVKYLNDFDMKTKEQMNILRQIKNIILYLKKKNIVHGDLRFANVLYKDKKIRLTDLNNMIFPGELPVRLNYLYSRWYDAADSEIYLDDLAFNLMTYLLLNYDLDNLRDILNNQKDVKIDEIENLLAVDEDLFEDEVIDIVKLAFLGDKGAMRHLKPNTFLIDHLKK